MIAVPRAVIESEQEAALNLWDKVFEDTPSDYFSRYFDSDEQHQPGDLIGIWDGATLVSTVLLCRRRLAWNGGTLLCGAIANVATDPGYRRRGFSSLLLREIILKMQREEFDFSLLGTGTHAHYASLGWEQILRPQLTINLHADTPFRNAGNWQPVHSINNLISLYEQSPRPLQLIRSPHYFNEWVGWIWRSHTAEIHSMDSGYVVAEFPGDHEEPVLLLEWRAADAASEHLLLQAVIAEASRRLYASVFLSAIPQFIDKSASEDFGTLREETEDAGMICRISLLPEDFAQVGEAYRNGAAAWWESDGF